ncbi:restriction endonuclease subunit S [Ruegeria atlantica]|uniref:restriction endonuclease subunit S n=1 Tax=Ruegeria atlantica TaxID=81569 RepID=UPI0014813779|nr:restriction endonuclease subunit S [Ruegeria atlantica]
MKQLPETWTLVALGELADFEMGQAPPASECNKDGIGTPFVKAGEFGIERPIIREWTTKPLKFANEADVLICVVGATAGKLNLGANCAIGRSAAAVRPTDAIDQLYLHKFLKTRVQHLRAGSTGSAQGVISKATLAKETVPLAPMCEQRRIVEKLDRLSERSSAAREHLARVTTLADRAKQAILSSLLDQESNVVELGRLAREIRYGTSKKCGYKNGSTPVLRIPNVTSGTVDAHDLKFADFDQKELRKLCLKAGDLLMIRSNGSLNLVGRTAVVEEKQAGFLFAGYLIRIRSDLSKVDPRYLQLVLMSAKTRRFIESLAKSTSGVNNINSAQIANIPVPITSIEQQRDIAGRAKAAFARIDRLREEASRASHLLDRLDERLLAKAFQGELVPQDPDDEPVETLLERIRVARAASPKPKRTRKKKAAVD